MPHLRRVTFFIWLFGFAVTFLSFRYTHGKQLATGPTVQTMATGRGMAATPSRRQLRIRSLSVEHNQREDNYPAARITADVQAIGLRGNPIRLEVRVRTLDGRLLPARVGFPPRHSDTQGFISVAPDEIRLDAALWTPWIFIPYEQIELPDPPPPLVVSARVFCAGLSSQNEIEMRLSPMPDLRQPRTIHLLDSSQQPWQTTAPSLQTSANAAPGGFRATPVKNATGVVGTVEADGLEGETLNLALRLRRPEGTPVRASTSAPPGFADDQGIFVSRFQDVIRFANARWEALRALIPAGAYEPPAAGSLVLGYYVIAGPLHAWSEEDFPASIEPGGLHGDPFPGDKPVPLRPADNPEEQAVCSVTTLFIEAILKRDEGALRELTTGRLAAERKPASSAVSGFQHEIRQAAVSGDSARVVVWVKDQAVQSGQGELMLKLQLTRTIAGWIVSWLEFDPYVNNRNPAKRQS